MLPVTVIKSLTTCFDDNKVLPVSRMETVSVPTCTSSSLFDKFGTAQTNCGFMNNTSFMTTWAERAAGMKTYFCAHATHSTMIVYHQMLKWRVTHPYTAGNFTDRDNFYPPAISGPWNDIWAWSSESYRSTFDFEQEIITAVFAINTTYLNTVGLYPVACPTMGGTSAQKTVNRWVIDGTMISGSSQYTIQRAGWYINDFTVPGQVNVSRRTDSEDVSIVFNARLDTVTIRNDLDENIMCLITKDGMEHNLDVKKRSASSFVLSENAYIQSGYLRVVCSDSSKIQIETAEFYLYARKLVRVSECDFCWLFFEEFSEQPLGRKILLVLFYALILIVVVQLRKPILSALSKLLSGLAWLGRFIFMVLPKWLMKMTRNSSWYKSLSKSLGEMSKEAEMPAENDGETQIQMDEVKPKVSKKRYVIPTNMAILMALALPLVLADTVPKCTVSDVQTSDYTSCTGGNCLTSFSSSLNFKIAGQTGCVVSKSKKDQVGATFFVQLENVTAMARMSVEYYTSDWEKKVSTIQSCVDFGTYCTVINGGCESVASSDATAGGQITGYATKYPGISDCERVKAISSLGCLLDTALGFTGCLAAREFIVPVGDIAAVKRVTSVEYVPWFSVWKVVNATNILLGRLSYGAPLVLSGVSFSANVPSVGKVANWDGKYIVHWANQTMVTNASPKNQPQVAVIGDIQSSSINGLASPSRTSFIYNQDVLRLTYSDTAVSAYSAKAGWDAGLLKKNTPYTIDGVSWDLSQDLTSLSGLYLDTVSVDLSVTATDLSVVAETTSVCPEYEEVTQRVGGCYNCDEGYAFNMEMRSTCDEGTVYAYSDDVDLQTNSFYLTKSFENYHVTFKSEKASGEANINFKGSKSTTTVKVQYSGNNGILLSSKALENRTLVTNDDLSGFGNFMRAQSWDPRDWANKIALPNTDWSTWLIAGVSIAGAIVFIILVLMVVKMWRSKREVNVSIKNK